MMLLQDTINRAGQLVSQREFAQAEGLYRQILSQQPRHTESYYQLGNIFRDTGRIEEAIFAFNRAAELDPNFVQAWSDLGGVLCHARRYEQGAQACRRALALERNRFAPLLNLASALLELGQLEEAVAVCRRAAAVRPESGMAHYTLGNALDRIGQTQEAAAAYRQAVNVQPDMMAAHYNLGNMLCKLSALDDAAAAYRQATALRPDFASAHYNLGKLLHDHGHLAEGELEYRRAIAADPKLANAHYNLANLCKETGRLEEAAAGHRTTMALQPDWPQARNNLAGDLAAMGQFDLAVDLYRQTVMLWPDLAVSHWNLGLELLRQGDFARGWPEFEWRWKVKELNLGGERFTQPIWDGRDLGGKRILINGEQGFGDVIQFARYLPAVAARGGEIILICPREVMTLLQATEGSAGQSVRQWVGLDDALPDHDVYCPLMTLPRIFKTSMENIPSAIPYIAADSAKAALGRAPGSDRRLLKVGLIWAGRVIPDPLRSIHLHRLAQLGKIGGIHWVSLQRDEAAIQARTPPAGLELTDCAAELNDFSDTAGAMANLDLVITIDPATAHLAGAMGKPVWTLLPFVADWRWLLNRNDSPWYPTMRLFRQPRRGDWETVVKEVSIALSQSAERQGLRTED